MWKLEKPLLDEALEDIENIIAESNSNLDEQSKVKLQYVFRLYERNKGSVADVDLNRFQIKRRIPYIICMVQRLMKTSLCFTFGNNFSQRKTCVHYVVSILQVS